MRRAAGIFEKRKRAAAEAEANLVNRQQQFFVQDIADGNLRAIGEYVTFRQSDAKPRSVERHGSQGLRQRGKRRADEGNVGLAGRHLLDQLFHCHAGQQFKRHVWVLVTIAGNERG